MASRATQLNRFARGAAEPYGPRVAALLARPIHRLHRRPEKAAPVLEELVAIPPFFREGVLAAVAVERAAKGGDLVGRVRVEVREAGSQRRVRQGAEMRGTADRQGDQARRSRRRAKTPQGDVEDDARCAR